MLYSITFVNKESSGLGTEVGKGRSFGSSTMDSGDLSEGQGGRPQVAGGVVEGQAAVQIFGSHVVEGFADMHEQFEEESQCRLQMWEV